MATSSNSPIVLTVALAMWSAGMRPVHAAPAAAEAEATVGTPATAEAAVEAGDLTRAVELAQAERKADPSPATWKVEAEALEAAGRFPEAAAAYQSLLDALPADAKAARTAAREAQQRNQARARGTVADEPKSTHREALDDNWARAGKTTPKPKKTPRRPAPPTHTDDDRIITKWYFWVTVGAIVASAAAVTGIAIKASRDDEPDALGLELRPQPTGPTVFRF